MNHRRRLPRRAMSVATAALLAFPVLSGAASAATMLELAGGVTPGFSANMQPNAITTGPDGNIWFTESADPGGVVHANPNGSVTELSPITTCSVTSTSRVAAVLCGTPSSTMAPDPAETASAAS